MLPKKHRLKKKKSFDLVFKKGKVFFEKFLILKKLENNLKESRFGFVVSLKISKKAKERNKVKRRLREVIKNKLSQIKTGYDIIFLSKKGIEEIDFREIKEIIEKLLEKAKLIK